MTVQEQAQLKEVKNEVRAIRHENKDFRDEVRTDIKEIKTLIEQIPKDYIPRTWANTTVHVFKWVIGTIIGIAAVIAVWEHK